MAPESSSSTSVFGRRPSLFSGKKRKESNINNTTPISPPPLQVSEEALPTNRRNSSVVSPPSSVNENSSGNLQRSTSLASRDSQSSLTRHKSRAPSVANIPPPRSPIRVHRVSRSISANAAHSMGKLGSLSSTALSPQKSSENMSQSPLTRSRDHPHLGSFDAPPKTPFSMLAAPFGHGVKRQDTSASTFSLKPSISGESGGATAPAGPVGGVLNPTYIHHNIIETAKKRIATLEYLRKIHEGQIYYFNTVHYTPTNINQMSSMLPSKLGRRATNYLLLGTSIPPLLDLNSGNPLEYLRVLYAVLAEFEIFQNLNSENGAGGLTRGRMGQMFKSGMRGVRTGRRSSAATTDNVFMDMDNNASTTTLDAMPIPPVTSYGHHQEFVHLQTPSLPFDPDFSTSFATLTDILIDTYDGVMQLLPGPEACNPVVNEAFIKADKLMRKILVQNVVSEFEVNTRKEVRSEVAGLGKVVLSGLM